MRWAVDGCSPVRSLISFSDTGIGVLGQQVQQRETALQHLDRGRVGVFAAHGGGVSGGSGDILHRDNDSLHTGI